jgi:predicted transcriptional regulator
MSTTSKTVTIGTQSIESMWADLSRRASVKQPPHGSMTVYDFAKLAGQTVPSARYFLNNEVRAGRMIADNYSIWRSGQKHTVKLFTPVAK